MPSRKLKLGTRGDPVRIVDDEGSSDPVELVEDGRFENVRESSRGPSTPVRVKKDKRRFYSISGTILPLFNLPDSITVYFGSESVNITAEDNWEYTIENIPPGTSNIVSCFAWGVGIIQDWEPIQINVDDIQSDLTGQDFYFLG